MMVSSVRWALVAAVLGLAWFAASPALAHGTHHHGSAPATTSHHVHDTDAAATTADAASDIATPETIDSHAPAQDNPRGCVDTCCGTVCCTAAVMPGLFLHPDLCGRPITVGLPSEDLERLPPPSLRRPPRSIA
jgi:hypothetical protein